MTRKDFFKCISRLNLFQQNYIIDLYKNEISNITTVGNKRSDVEIGLYYNVTRYYNPQWGRFLNADSVDYLDPESIGGLNLYTYCGNNPIMRIDPFGNAWYHWVIGAAIVVGLGIAVVCTAGGALAAYGAVVMAANGVASAGMWTTITAFAFVGATTAYAGAAIVASGDAIISMANGNSFNSSFNDMMNAGESAMWSTAGAGAFGGIGGYASWKQQIGSASQAGFMNKSDKDMQRTKYWISQGYADGKPPKGLEISHIYGTYGNNRNYFIVQNKHDHRLGPNSFHGIHGFKTNGGPFHRANPNYNNWWDTVRRFLGY